MDCSYKNNDTVELLAKKLSEQHPLADSERFRQDAEIIDDCRDAVKQAIWDGFEFGDDSDNALRRIERRAMELLAPQARLHDHAAVLRQKLLYGDIRRWSNGTQQKAINYALLPLEKRRTALTPRAYRMRKRRIERQTIEALAYISRTGYEVSTRYNQETRKQQHKQNEEYLKSHTAFNKTTGQVLTLAECTRTEKQRFAESYTIMRGIEKEADNDGLCGYFMTATLEPKFHIKPRNGNNSWNGTLPHQSQAIIQERFARARARLAKKKIKVLGVRVAEPHKDGTPHSHWLVFVKPEQSEAMEREFRREFDYSEKALDFRAIDKTKATAATYVMKYIQKHSNSDHLEVDTWRATNGIRAYQFLGLPRGCITAWREFRRVKEAPSDFQPRKLWEAARGGRFNSFLMLWKYWNGLFEPDIRVRTERVVGLYGVHKIKTEIFVGITFTATGWSSETHGMWAVTVIPKYPRRRPLRMLGGGQGPPLTPRTTPSGTTEMTK